MRINILVLVFFIFSASLFSNQNKGKEITGSWKIAAVEIFSSSQKKLEPNTNNCYLFDLYTNEGRLLFTADGKVQYENSKVPTDVRYSFYGNTLLLTDGSAISVNSQDRKMNAVSFQIEFRKNKIILKKVSESQTEIYTLTK